MKIIVMLNILIVIFLFIKCGGCVSDSNKKIINDYYYYFEGKGEAVIYREHYMNTDIIPCDVIAYDNNNNYIIACQHPNKECCACDTIRYEIKDSIYFWIIDVKKNIFYGPLTVNEYFEKRQKLKVPNDLKLEIEI